jgi:hypothetical protein
MIGSMFEQTCGLLGLLGRERISVSILMFLLVMWE